MDHVRVHTSNKAGSNDICSYDSGKNIKNVACIKKFNLFITNFIK
jgi:hypothetical protein